VPTIKKGSEFCSNPAWVVRSDVPSTENCYFDLHVHCWICGFKKSE
jgi:hypothetical protein